jgi:hypothetical protein
MIPDAIRDGLDAELEGTDYDAKTSVEEVITRLGVSGLIEVMEQLKLIKKRRRVRVA